MHTQKNSTKHVLINSNKSNLSTKIILVRLRQCLTSVHRQHFHRHVFALPCAFIYIFIRASKSRTTTKFPQKGNLPLQHRCHPLALATHDSSRHRYRTDRSARACTRHLRREQQWSLNPPLVALLPLRRLHMQPSIAFALAAREVYESSDIFFRVQTNLTASTTPSVCWTVLDCTFDSACSSCPRTFARSALSAAADWTSAAFGRNCSSRASAMKPNANCTACVVTTVTRIVFFRRARSFVPEHLGRVVPRTQQTSNHDLYNKRYV